ncbi:hypothetical protein [Trujillonella endophytica]|uniref:Uncharacterized protein n=1 Tax=Trujillonella endophytica TaxID=673521 RepID=A0A1H8V9N1_9ACTN|nr:hypothetical protein [Trujillella endophytica]SEP12115.1 hypothetical protein SAMN05660991_03371 [Trujillella endophytica]
MASGRIRRSARRGPAGALLLWLVLLAAAVLAAPGASADPDGRVGPAVEIPIRDLTPPYVSVDDGDTVRFVNQIQDKTVQVGGGGLLPTLISVTVRTEVTLTMPSGTRVLPPGGSWDETFDRDCSLPGLIDVCLIGYTYRLQSNASLTSVLTDAVLRLLPPLPVPTPFVVTTLPLPNLPGINLPRLPVLDVPTLLPGVGAVVPQLLPQTQPPAGPAVPPAALPAPAAGPSGIDGSPYAYDTGTGAAAMSPAGSVAVVLDLARVVPASGAGSAAGGGGSGGAAGRYDGASVPVFGRLSGLEDPALDEESATSAGPAGAGEPTLPLPALVAVVALAATTAALVRTGAGTRSAGSHRSR